MKKTRNLLLGTLMGVVAGAAAFAADIEATTPDGRRVLLKDDMTWRYVDGATPTPGERSAADAAKDPAAAQPKDEGEAILTLEERIPGNRICRFRFKLVNNLPYEIRSLVPELSVYRSNDVRYDSVFTGFSFLKPGDAQTREARFNGIACEDIARLQVGGGDRCEMGELDKFSSAKGQCLSLVRVVPSTIVRFDK
jgi:hypothetical protein